MKLSVKLINPYLLTAIIAALMALPVIFFPAALQAQSPSAVVSAFTCGKSIEVPAAEKVVASVQSSFGKIKTLRAQFFQDSYLSSVDQSELSGGQVTLMRPGKMRWHYDTPEEQIFIVNNSTLWLYQPKMKQVVIDKLDKVLISQLPTAFLMGVGDLTRDFQVKSGCETKGAYLINLAPAAKSAEVGELAAFDLLVDKVNFFPLGAQVVDVAANRTSIILRSLVAEDKSIKEKDFEFVAPDKIDIDDRRKST